MYLLVAYLFYVFVLLSIFPDLLVARSVSWQETLSMYKYISTYAASLDKRRFFLFLYQFTWYIQSLLTRHTFLLMFVYVFFLSSFHLSRTIRCAKCLLARDTL